MSGNQNGMQPLLEEMHQMSESVGSPYAKWRLTESAESKGINKRAAYEAVSPVQQHLGHAVQAIYGEEFEAAKEILLTTRKQIDEALAALGVGTTLHSGS